MYLGRMDNQVKVRGYRVELGEIEAVLRRHPQVIKSAVMTRQPKAGDLQVVAYVTGNEANAPSVEQLRLWLMEQLPEPMVPQHIVIVDQLPLNARGKLDRGALAKMALPERTSAGFDRPLSPGIEQKIAEIWMDLLEKKDVRPNDSFLEIGGHSLSVLQMLSRVRDTFGVEVPIRRFFAAPSIAELAKVIATKSSATPRRAQSAKIMRRTRGNRPLPDFAGPGFSH